MTTKIRRNQMELTWDYLIFFPSVQEATISGGKVRKHTKNGLSVYRFIPTPYNPTQDAFYESFTSGTLSGLITTRG